MDVDLKTREYCRRERHQNRYIKERQEEEKGSREGVHSSWKIKLEKRRYSYDEGKDSWLISDWRGMEQERKGKGARRGAVVP